MIIIDSPFALSIKRKQYMCDAKYEHLSNRNYHGNIISHIYVHSFP